MYETAVLIVGAGPTGLTLAIDLALRGISFRLIEAASTPFEVSRGKGIQPRTLEIFDERGVIGAILAAGGPYPKFRTHLGPFSLRAGGLSSVKRPIESVPYPNLWMVPQARTESILRSVFAVWAATSSSAKSSRSSDRMSTEWRRHSRPVKW